MQGLFEDITGGTWEVWVDKEGVWVGSRWEYELGQVW